MMERLAWLLPGGRHTAEEDVTMDDNQKDQWAGVLFVGMLLGLLLGGLGSCSAACCSCGCRGSREHSSAAPQ